MGATWKYVLHNSEKEFVEAHPDCPNAGALVDIKLRELHFMKSQLDIGTIRHEVRHAFISELCLCGVDLDIYQFEEIQCILDQNRWDQMDEVSKIIYENLILT